MVDLKIGPAADTVQAWEKFLPLAPTLIWAGLILVIFYSLGIGTVRKLLDRAQKIGVAGFQLDLREEIDAAANFRKAPLSPLGKTKIAQRLADSAALFTGTRILWVDDIMSGNEIEIDILLKLGVVLDFARSTDEARAKLPGGAYSIVISDMKRDVNHSAGLNIIPLLANHPSKPLLIFYVGSPILDRPRPAFGITNRPDELFHLLIEALERRNH